MVENRNASSGVRIEEVQPYQGVEVIKIVNHSENEQPLTGWSIVTTDGMFVFKMPMDVSMKPGERLEVACTSKRQIRGKFDLIWKRHKRLNANWDDLLLIDSSGKVAHRYQYGRLREGVQKRFSLQRWVERRLAKQDAR